MFDALIAMEDPKARDQRRESIVQTPASTPFAPSTQRIPITTRVFVFSIVHFLNFILLKCRQVVSNQVRSGRSRMPLVVQRIGRHRLVQNQWKRKDLFEQVDVADDYRTV